MTDIYIGIDLGGTNIKLGCFDPDLNLLCNDSVAFKADSPPPAVVDKIAIAIEKLLAENTLTLTGVKAVGLGAPGPSDIAKGVIIASPNLPLFKNTPLRDMIADKLGKPTIFENDANAACFGEYTLGAGKGVKDIAFFTLGTGIGGGIVSDGKLVHGYKDAAAELGHTIIYPEGRLCNCGQKGCVEAYASALSTAKIATEALAKDKLSTLRTILEKDRTITCKDVFDHARAGDKLAIEITDQTAKALALLCVSVLHSTGPERIVFAGGMIAAGEPLLDRIKHHFDKQIWSIKKETVEICFATLGENAGIIGAAALAKTL